MQILRPTASQKQIRSDDHCFELDRSQNVKSSKYQDFRARNLGLRRRSLMQVGLLGGSAAVATVLVYPSASMATSNIEVLRALERRKQALEPTRRGVRTLDRLQEQLLQLSELVDESLVAAQRTNDIRSIRPVLNRLEGQLPNAALFWKQRCIIRRLVERQAFLNIIWFD